GVTIYGNREIALAYNRNKQVLSKVSWEIYVFKALITIGVIVVYFIVALFQDNSIYLFIKSLTILTVFFYVSWLFMGIEDFKK
ncbi:flippase, partial [Enterococcus faecalis]|nr:flippase [Enterococcus faecalis]